MSLFDIFKKHKNEVKMTYGGITFRAPKPMSNDEYQKFRKAQADWLEKHYDLNSIEGVRSIPVSANLPKYPKSGAMDVTGDVDYYLRQKSHEHEQNGNMELAILCLQKSNAIRELTFNGYRKSDYYALVRILARDGQIDAAQAEKNRLDKKFRNDHFEGEDKVIETEARRGNEVRAFVWIQQNLPELCPKSLSGFRRMKSQNTKNYQKIVQAAAEKGYTIK